jgi:uncharacterized surface protein with fasciclin (FAS1) repeats
MRKLSRFTIITLVIGILVSLNLSAFNNSCRRAALIDVRGNADLDSNGDGKVTIAEVAVANPLGNLDELVAAVLAADPAVLEALSDPDQVLTVFAPENDAFLAIPEPIRDLLETPGAQPILTDTLLLHVVAGKFDPRKIWYIRSVESLLGQDLFFKRGRSNPTVNQSNVDCTGVRTDNGYVWFIDSVLQIQY